MEFKITWLTLIVKPKYSVDENEFYRSLLEFLGLLSKESEIIGKGAGRFYKKVMEYKGIFICIPRSEYQGYKIEFSTKGLDTFSNLFGYSLKDVISSFYYVLSDTCDVFCSRIDIETNYLPYRIRKAFPKIKNNSVVYVGSRASNILARYQNRVIEYSFKSTSAFNILSYIVEFDDFAFGSRFQTLIDNWKPVNFSISDIKQL